MNVIDIIFRELQNYSTRTTSLPKVTTAISQVLRDYGYTVTVLPLRHRDSKVIQVDGCSYNIIRNRDWIRYEVRQIDL